MYPTTLEPVWNSCLSCNADVGDPREAIVGPGFKVKLFTQHRVFPGTFRGRALNTGIDLYLDLRTKLAWKRMSSTS